MQYARAAVPQIKNVNAGRDQSVSARTVSTQLQRAEIIVGLHELPIITKINYHWRDTS